MPLCIGFAGGVSRGAKTALRALLASRRAHVDVQDVRSSRLRSAASAAKAQGPGQSISGAGREDINGVRNQALVPAGLREVKRLSRHKRCPLRAAPHVFHGAPDFSSPRRYGVCISAPEECRSAVSPEECGGYGGRAAPGRSRHPRRCARRYRQGDAGGQACIADSSEGEFSTPGSSRHFRRCAITTAMVPLPRMGGHSG
jgi:hypothetical protein